MFVIARLLFMQSVLNAHGMTIEYSPWRGKGLEFRIMRVIHE